MCFEPRIGGIGVDVSERTVESLCQTLYLLEDTFEEVAIAEGFVAEMHAEFVKTSLQLLCTIDQEFGSSRAYFSRSFRMNLFVNARFLAG